MEYTNTTPLLFLLLLSVVIALGSTAAEAKSKISGIYAFGDSIFDAGNNNHLLTVCRSDHKPYGMDFPNKVASGRFTDGMTAADILISRLGIKAVLPAYKDSAVRFGDLHSGVSFASVCSGFDDLTPMDTGVLSMDKQFEYFEEAFERMNKYMGTNKTEKAVENALFLISGGTNDMNYNYYLLPLRKVAYSVSQYHDLLLKNLHTFIEKLHNKGARKVAVLGMPPLGCLPVDMTVSESLKGKHRQCVAQHNTDARSYNFKLEALLKKLNRQMQHSKIVYADVYGPLMEMIKKPNKFGFNNTVDGCCGTGKFELGFLCNKLAKTCSDPSKYLFWDAAHPTEAAYKILTKKFQDTVLFTLLS